MWGGFLEVVRVDLEDEAQFKVAGGGTAWFLGVGASMQKVERGDILPRRRHLVCAYFKEIGPVSVTDTVAVHLKYLCHW